MLCLCGFELYSRWVPLSRVVHDVPRKICGEKEGDCGKALDSLTCCSSKEMVFTAAHDHSSVA